jgi:predicted RNA-binding Zn ribbon-like protein
MGFGADLLEALAECADLINTGRGTSVGLAGAGISVACASSSTGPAGAATGADQLATLADVVAFAREHRVENLAAARASDVPRLHDLRGRLDAAAVACENDDVRGAIGALNSLLAETGAVPQIVSHDGRGPHIHVSRATAPLADRIAAHCAMGLAELVVAGARARVRTCASPTCQALFIDLSRNQSRRYCDSRTCGNRLHVAAYRSRHSATAQWPSRSDDGDQSGRNVPGA